MGGERERRASGCRWSAALVVVVVLQGCGGESDRAGPPKVAAPADTGATEGRLPMRPIEQVQEAHTPALMKLEGVVGTFLGETADGKPCIKVMVVQRTRELEAKIPQTLEGYPVEIFESGEVRPLRQQH